MNSWPETQGFDTLQTLPEKDDAIFTTIGGRPAVFSSQAHVYRPNVLRGWAERVVGLVYTLQFDAWPTYFLASSTDTATCVIAGAGAPMVVNRYSNFTGNVHLNTGSNLMELTVLVTQWVVNDETQQAFCRSVTNGTLSTEGPFNATSAARYLIPYVGGGLVYRTPAIFWHEINLGPQHIEKQFTDDDLVLLWNNLYTKWSSLSV